MDSIFKIQDVIFAHCLTQNGGAGNPFSIGKDLYQRMEDVISNKPEISCSTIKIDDTIIYLRRKNLFGPVGIILKNINVTFASPTDCGTGVDENGKRIYNLTDDTKPNKENILKAIVERPTDSYNELCADNYDFFGIFLCFDDTAYLYQNIKSEEEFFEKTKQFNLPYFNLSKGVLYKSKFETERKCFVGNGKLSNIEIYE
jgi:hypothetical protein